MRFMAKEEKKENAKDQEKKGSRPKKLIEDFGKEIVSDIHGQRPPMFKTVARTRSNIVYDKKQGFLTLGKAMEERNFVNIAASTLLVTPPTGSTSPLTESDPVIATD